MTSDDNYYEEMLEEGESYQGFVKKLIKDKLEINLDFYDTQRNQIEKGETYQGFEVKYDRHFKNSGNLWIEVEERRQPVGEYVPSGIFRDDNSWLYVIGNRNKVFIFSKRTLKLNLSHLDKVENKRKTSMGYLINEKQANYLAELVLRVEDN